MISPVRVSCSSDAGRDREPVVERLDLGVGGPMRVPCVGGCRPRRTPAALYRPRARADRTGGVRPPPILRAPCARPRSAPRFATSSPATTTSWCRRRRSSRPRSTRRCCSRPPACSRSSRTSSASRRRPARVSRRSRSASARPTSTRSASTARHLTFFEMMGNFSFGDYFKEGAIAHAWELSLQGVGDRPGAALGDGLRGRRGDGVPRDDEAIELWRAIGQPAERIVALGEDNFWKAGPTGPCGPCSELFYDRGPEHGCGRPLGRGPDECGPQCDCDRLLEYWNLVFMQYDRSDDGPDAAAEAAHRHRRRRRARRRPCCRASTRSTRPTASRPSSRPASRWSGARYTDEGRSQRALRVLADHGRGDGVPGHRRRHPVERAAAATSCAGSSAGPSRTATASVCASPFLTPLHDVIVEQFGEAYPGSRRSTATRWPDPGGRGGAVRAHARDRAPPSSTT